MKLWVAYYHDGSSIVPFETELGALRWAVENGMAVESIELNDDEPTDVAMLARS